MKKNYVIYIEFFFFMVTYEVHYTWDPILQSKLEYFNMLVFFFSMGPSFSSLLQHYGPHLSMGPWYMVVHQALMTTLS